MLSRSSLAGAQAMAGQGGARGRAVRAATAAVISALLAACTSVGGASSSAVIQNPTSTPVPDKNKPHYTAADFAKDSYCPPVVIRAGTEAMSLYEHGHEAEPDYVRFPVRSPRRRANAIRKATRCR